MKRPCLTRNVFPLQTEQAVELLAKFETIRTSQLDINAKHVELLSIYGKDLELVRRIYQNEKSDPLTPRNLPPIAGRIAWARQLFRRIEVPMKVFKRKSDILKVRFESL